VSLRSRLDRSAPSDALIEPAPGVVRSWDVGHMTRERRLFVWRAHIIRPHQPDPTCVATTRLTLKKNLPMSPTLSGTHRRYPRGYRAPGAA